MAKRKTPIKVKAKRRAKRVEGPIFDMSDAMQFARLVAYVMRLKDRGMWEITFHKVRNTRTNRQNNYYWGVVLPRAAKGFRDCFGEPDDVEGGFNSQDAHEFFKTMFLSRTIGLNADTGEAAGIIPGTTTTLDTAQFAHYVDQIVVWCAEKLSVEIPPPATDIAPPPKTLDDGPDAIDREIEQAAGTPRELT